MNCALCTCVEVKNLIIMYEYEVDVFPLPLLSVSCRQVIVK